MLADNNQNTLTGWLRNRARQKFPYMLGNDFKILTHQASRGAGGRDSSRCSAQWRVPTQIWSFQTPNLSRHSQCVHFYVAAQNSHANENVLLLRIRACCVKAAALLLTAYFAKKKQRAFTEIVYVTAE